MGCIKLDRGCTGLALNYDVGRAACGVRRAACGMRREVKDQKSGFPNQKSKITNHFS